MNDIFTPRTAGAPRQFPISRDDRVWIAALVALAAVALLAGCTQPPSINAVATNGKCITGPCTAEMLDYQPDRPASTVVEWASYVDADGRERLNGTAGYRITSPGNTLSAETEGGIDP